MGLEMLNMLATGRGLQLATNHLMLVTAAVFFVSAFAIALAPKASRAVDASAVGH